MLGEFLQIFLSHMLTTDSSHVMSPGIMLSQALDANSMAIDNVSQYTPEFQDQGQLTANGHFMCGNEMPSISHDAVLHLKIP